MFLLFIRATKTTREVTVMTDGSFQLGGSCWISLTLQSFIIPPQQTSSHGGWCGFSGGRTTACLTLLTFSALLPPLPPQGANNPGNKRRHWKGTGWLHLWLHTERLIWLAGQLQPIKSNVSQAPIQKLFTFHQAWAKPQHSHFVSAGDSCCAPVIMLTG